MTNPDLANAPHAAATPADDRAFFGHPRGLGFLAFTEAWERFSFYGMQSLLVLYMAQELLLPGHVENVAGMATYRASIESVLGPLSPQALAGQTFGLYAGLVYFTALLGGWIADRWLGARTTVVIGVLLMTAGHAAMVFEASFLIALLLLILGSGALKGNIAAQVGMLYRADDERVTRGFAIFSTAINVGSIFGPLACGLLVQIYGWHYGFGLAGLLMLLALAIYLKGMHLLPDRVAPATEAPDGSPSDSSPGDDLRRQLGLLVVVLAMVVVFMLGFEQMLNMGMVWIASEVDLATPLGLMPVAWFVSISATAVVVSTIGFIAYWRKMAMRGEEPRFSTKIGFGALLIGIGAGLLAVGSATGESGRISVAIPIIAYLITGVGFAGMWPSVLAVIGRYAPPRIGARMMAAAYLTIFVSSAMAGYVATFYETMPPEAFWTLNVGFCLAGSALFFVLGPALFRALDAGLPAGQTPASAPTST